MHDKYPSRAEKISTALSIAAVVFLALAGLSGIFEGFREHHKLPKTLSPFFWHTTR